MTAIVKEDLQSFVARQAECGILGVMDHRLGRRIEIARRSAGLSREQLANAIGKSRGMIGHYETNEHEPSLSTLHAIADATDTPLIDLLGIQLSRRDLLRALVNDEGQSANPGPDRPIRGIVIGLLVETADEDHQ